MQEPISVASKDQLEEGVPAKAKIDGTELVVVKVGGEVSVFQGRCPHQGTPLSSAAVEGANLVCSAHGWTFDAKSGARVGEPLPCLQKFACTEQNGEILVSAAEVRAWSAAKSAAAAKPARGRPISELPGPKALPLIGHALTLDMRRLHLQLVEWARAHGDTYRLTLPQGDVVVTAKSDLIRTILKDRPDNYRRIRTFEPLFKELSAHGVFSEEGENWARQRRLTTPALNTKTLRGFYEQMKKITLRLKARWERAADRKEVLNATDEMTRFAVDITTNLAFGYDMNTIEDQGGTLQQNLDVLLPAIADRSVAAFPYWRYFKLPRDRRVDRALVEVKKTVEELVGHAKQKLQAEGPDAKPTTFIEALLLARDEDGSRLSEQEIFGNALTMLLAGEDTTANTMAWIVHYMSDIPEVQERMRLEADGVLGAGDVLPSLADADRLDYIEAVTHEAMRLKPVAPLFFMEPNVDVELDGYAVPKGTTMFLVTCDPPQRDAHFERASEFNPDRWLQNEKSAPGHDVDAFMPFGYGPRHCPGRSLALLEIKAVMAMLCRSFTVKKTSPHPPVDEIFGFTMHPSKVEMVLARR